MKKDTWRLGVFSPFLGSWNYHFTKNNEMKTNMKPYANRKTARGAAVRIAKKYNLKFEEI